MTSNCQICGASYKYCPNCDRIDSYKKVVDEADCYKVYVVIYEYRTHVIDKDKAKEEFATIGITSKTLPNFRLIDSVRNYIADIVKEDEVTEIVEKTIEQEEKSDEEMTFKKSKKNK